MIKVYLIHALYSEEMRKLEEREEEFLSVDARDWQFDEEEEVRPYQVVDGIAMMDIRGKMLGEGNFFTKAFGIASYDDIGNSLAMMSADDEVEQVLISASTPGGHVSGISDLSDTWGKLNAEKPITVHTPGTLASAGVWLASNSTNIYASESAEVGSIGVILQHVSQEARLKKEGIKVTEIKSAPLKYVGSAAKDLSAEERDHLQQKVDESAELFKKQVYRTRPGVTAEAFTGEMFSASDAQRIGLIDGVMTFSDVFAKLSANSGDRNINSSYPEVDMKRKVTQAMFSAAVEAGADPDSMEIVSQEVYDASQAGEENITYVTQEIFDAAVEAGDDMTDFEVISQEEYDRIQAEAGDDGTAIEVVEGEELEFEGLHERVDELTEEVGAANAMIDSLAEENETLKAQVAAASDTPLRGIAEDRIKTMRIALGLTAIDMSEFPVESLVAEYEALDKQFKSAFKAGGYAPAKKVEEPEPVATAEVTSIDRARLRAVGIK